MLDILLPDLNSFNNSAFEKNPTEIHLIKNIWHKKLMQILDTSVQYDIKFELRYCKSRKFGGYNIWRNGQILI